MSTPSPVNGPVSPAPSPAEEPVSPEQIREFLRGARGQQSLAMALAAGSAAMIAGAAVWAAISFASNLQIGWMAIGVGLLVGFAIRWAGRSFDRTFGYLGAGLSLVGCLLGNLLMVCAFIAREHSLGFFTVLGRVDLPMAARMLAATFSPIDVLFYGLALYYGYRYSFRRLTGQEIARLAKRPA